MIVVFTGPTLGPIEARTWLDAVYLPPVSQGDVYRVTEHRPDAIGIIDGYFDQVPSVWHKEILWAIKQGIRVYGSASMGALRACELAPFGMIGVGRVFEAFQTGDLEDDDEVAVQHGPADSGYRRMSEAMVNIRATLEAAEEHGVASSSTRILLEGLAKDLHYADRDYPTLLRLGREHQVASKEIDRLEQWLPAGRIDQKRADALSMLTAIKESQTSVPLTEAIAYTFEHTTLWDELRQSAGHLAMPSDGDPTTLTRSSWIDELRLSQVNWRNVVAASMARKLAVREARRQGIAVSQDERLYDYMIRFRRGRGLLEGSDLAQWMDRNQLSDGDFLRLMEREATTSALAELMSDDLDAEMVDYARMEGVFPDMVRRALAKQAILGSIDALPPPPEMYHRAMQWFLGSGTGDPSEEARARGFDDVDRLKRAVLGEYLYENPDGPSGAS